jgi:dTDP-4-dehydrorhamnose 3,5-epimerase|uniref:dTDP-4-dehydrorhamnose 3,5-epimerase n=1 Tax=Desulfobacca acetoxidans TaxID=60893 RepID=A0A7C5ERN6_9BACT
MQVSSLAFSEILLITPRVFRDVRGHFLEIFQARRYPEHGIPGTFVQDNISFSLRGVIRGLHYQLRHPQGKLVMPLTGEIWDVVVDLRRGSPDFGKWLAVTLKADTCQQLYVPPGFAHGFAVLSDTATVLYKCTDYWHPEDEYGVIWNDPDLAIPWPVTAPVLSEKDRQYPRLGDLSPGQLPVFGNEA